MRVDIPEYGTYVDFPDDISREEMLAVLNEQFPLGKQTDFSNFSPLYGKFKPSAAYPLPAKQEPKTPTPPLPVEQEPKTPIISQGSRSWFDALSDNIKNLLGISQEKDPVKSARAVVDIVSREAGEPYPETSLSDINIASAKSMFPLLGKAIGGVIRTLEEVGIRPLQELGGTLQNAILPGMNQEDLGHALFGKNVSPRPIEQSPIVTGSDIANYWDARNKEIQSDVNTNEGSIKDFYRMIAPNLLNNAAIAATALATGGSTLPLILMGVLTGGSKYHDLREGGMNPLTSLAGGTAVGLSESLTEIPTLKSLLNPALNFAKRLLLTSGVELTGEEVNTLVESAIDKVTITPDMTWQDLGKRLADTAIVTLASTGMLTGATHPIIKNIEKTRRYKDTINRIDNISREMFEQPQYSSNYWLNNELPISTQEGLPVKTKAEKTSVPEDEIGLSPELIAKKRATEQQLYEINNLRQSPLGRELLNKYYSELEKTGQEQLQQKGENTEKLPVSEETDKGENFNEYEPEVDLKNKYHIKAIRDYLLNTEGWSKIYDPEEHRVVGRTKSDRPEYIQAIARNYNVTYKTINGILNRALEDKPLTQKQQNILRDLLIVSKDELPLYNMKHGDKFKIGNEVYTHIGYDNEGNAVIKEDKEREILNEESQRQGNIFDKQTEIEQQKKSNPLLGQEGHIDIEPIAKALDSPKVAASLKTLGQPVNDAVDIIKGKKGIFSKLMSIPYRVAQRHQEFKPVFDAIQWNLGKANEIIDDAKSIFTDDIAKIVRSSNKIGEAKYSDQERVVIVYKRTLNGLIQSGLITEDDAKKVQYIMDKMPKHKGTTQELSEFVDKDVYEGLIKIANELGIKHKRMFDVGKKSTLGFSKGSEIATRYATELSVLAHEIGHQLDSKYNLWNTIVKEAVGVGKRGEVTKSASAKQRGIIKKELMALADLRLEDNASEYYAKYVRKKPEKMAQLLEGYIHAPDKFKEVAPNVYRAFENFIKSNPILSPLSEIKSGFLTKRNTVFSKGTLHGVLEKLIENKEISENDASMFVDVVRELNEFRRNQKEWGAIESQPVKKQGLEYNDEELKAMGFSDKEKEAYHKINDASRIASNYLKESIKTKLDYYSENTTDLQRKIMDLEIDDKIDKYGAYLPIMRFGDYWIEFKQDGQRNVRSFESLYDKNLAVEELKRQGIEVTEINMKDERERRKTYPYLSLDQLDKLLDDAEINKNDAEIKALRNILQERIGQPNLIKRKWVAGFERTGENVAKTLESFIENSVHKYIRTVSNREANKAIADIHNPALHKFAQKYLDSFNLSVKDPFVFKGLRQFVTTWYLLAKPTYFVQNLSATLRVLNRLSKEVGFGKDVLVWSKTTAMASQYIAHRTSELVNKPINAGLDTEYIMAMDKLRKRGDISLGWTKEMLGLDRSIRQKSNPVQLKDSLLNILNIAGSSADKFTRIHAATAGYIVGKRKGLTGDNLIKFMIDYINDTQTVYGNHNMPTLITEINNSVIKGGAKTLYMLQQYQLDWVQQMSGYLRGSFSGNEKIANMRGLLSSAITLGAIAGLKGIPLAYFIASVYGAITGDDLWKKIREMIRDRFGSRHQDISDAAIYGVISKLTGKDLSGMLGLGTFPFGLQVKDGELEYSTAIGGLADRAKRAYRFHEMGESNRIKEELMPDVIRNFLAGKRWEEEGAIRTIGGEAVKLGGEKIVPNEYDIRGKKLGFTPLELSKAYEEKGSENLMKKKHIDMTRKFKDKMVRAILYDDEKLRQNVYKELAEYNENNPDDRIRLNWREINKSVRMAKRGRDIKSIPKAIKSGVRESWNLYKKED